MSYERSIASQAVTPLSGSTSSPTSEDRGGVHVATGSTPAAADPRGHINHEQVIHHLLEMRANARTTRYINVPAGETVEINPGEYGYYILRLNGNASINLGKSPEVPDKQKTPNGKARHRSWPVMVQLYQAGTGYVSWSPEPVVGATAYRLIEEPDGNGGTLQELERYVDFPGVGDGEALPGRTDLLVLMYDERIGRWFGSAIVRNAIAGDPENPAEGGTEPPGGDDGDGWEPWLPPEEDNPTDGEYTDQYGNPFPVVDLAPGQGTLLVLGDGRLGRSTDCGATWSYTDKSPHGPAAFSALENGGCVVVANDGTVWWSDDLLAWKTVELPESDTPLGPSNGDFETGDLSGWTLMSGEVPTVLATIHPPQRPDSRFYLTRNQAGGDFTLEQDVELTDALVSQLTAGASLVLSADLYAASSATARVEVRVPFEGTTIYRPAGGQISPTATSNRDVKSSSIAAWTVTLHNVDPGQIGALTSARLVVSSGGGSDGHGTSFPVRLRESYSLGVGVGGVEYKGGFSNNHDNVPTEAERKQKRYFSEFGKTEKAITFKLTAVSVPDSWIEITVPVGWQAQVGRAFGKLQGTSSAGVWYFVNDTEGTAKNPAYPSLSLTADEADPIARLESLSEGGWVSKSIEFLASAPKLTIRVSGSGSPADAYFDNVDLKIRRKLTGKVLVARDLGNRRHVVAAGASVFTVASGSASPLQDAPIPAEMLVAHGDILAVASGQTIAWTRDDGQTWRTTECGKAVVQLGVSAETPPTKNPVTGAPSSSGLVLFALLDDGSFSRPDALPAATLSEDATFSCDSRRRVLIATSSTGYLSTAPEDMSAWTFVGTQPLKDAGPEAEHRETVPTDSGRWIGHGHGQHMFACEDGGATWVVTKAMPTAAVQILELK